MQLLVSVQDAAEASAAVAGGADIVDAKDPAVGSLGAVSIDTLREIIGCVEGRCPVTAALGDAVEETPLERDAAAFAAAGARLVKIGFAGVSDPQRAASLAAAAVRGAGRERVVLVGYADHQPARSISSRNVLQIAAAYGVAGVLLDTADKDGPALFELTAMRAVTEWVTAAHDARLLVAIAGRLSATDADRVRCTGADITGVRGAACQGGRSGRIAAEKVRMLKELLERDVARVSLI